MIDAEASLQQTGSLATDAADDCNQPTTFNFIPSHLVIRPSFPMNPPHSPHPSDISQTRYSGEHSDHDEGHSAAHGKLPEPRLPDLDLPHSDLDLTVTFDSILSEGSSEPTHPEVHKVQKRASNVLKLAQENDKLKEELRAMTERLEAAERKQRELTQKAAAGGGQGRPMKASYPSS